MKKRIIIFAFLIPMLLLYFPMQINAQSDQWIWMKGDNNFNGNGLYGQQGVPSPINNPRARAIGTDWKSASGDLWMFGGIGYNSSGQEDYLNDLWRYNVATNKWTWMKGKNTTAAFSIYGTQGTASAINNPGARKQCASWTDLSGNLWLMGGIGYGGTNVWGYLTDLWKYNISTNEWTWIKGDTISNQPVVYGVQGAASANNKPGARYASTTWVDSAGNFWLYGGYGLNASGTTYGLLNDLWKYSPTTNKWAWIKGSDTLNGKGVFGTKGISAVANKPSARAYGIGWADDVGNLYLFGGSGNDTTSYGWLNDLWKFNVTTKRWTWLSGDSSVNKPAVYGTQGVGATTNKPGARSSNISWKDKNGNLWLWGGYGFTSNSIGFLNDMWAFNTNTNKWTWKKGDTIRNINGVYGIQGVAANNNNPGSRESGFSWADSSGNLWLFGGYGYDATHTITGRLNDLWKYTPGILLPVHLLSFKGEMNNHKVSLDWKVENEQNFDAYHVERSIDGRTFSEIGEIKSANLRTYTFVDDILKIQSSTHLQKKIYYRLKMVDIDGKYSFSNTIAISLTSEKSFTIYPNPTNGGFKLLANNGITKVEITDATGRVVFKKTYNTNGSINISTFNFDAGTYFVKVMDIDGSFSQKLLIVQ